MKKFETLEEITEAAAIANGLRKLAIDSDKTISITMGAGGCSGSIVFFDGVELVWEDGWRLVKGEA